MTTDPKREAVAGIVPAAAELSEYARRYSELGWALIRADGKRPHDGAWQKTRVEEPGFAAGLWGHWGKRGINMGTVLGPSGLLVYEYDEPDGEQRFLELLGGQLPQTPVCRTGSAKLHCYFIDPGNVAKTARDGFELRVGEHHCLVPPSTHPATGRPYAWVPGHEPWTLAPLPVPPSLLEFFQAKTRKGAAVAVGEEIPERQRHTTLLSLAGSMRRRGMSANEILAALTIANEQRCKPPLPELEIAELAHDVAGRYQPASEQVPARRLEASRLSDAGLEEAVFVERPLLQVALTLLTGRPGVGKGALCAHWVARCTTGELYAQPMNVLWLSSEDDAAIDLGRRVEAAGGDRERVYLIPHTFQLPGDIDWLRETVTTIGDVGLVIIDPLGNHTGAANTDRDSDVRVALMPLAVLANEIRVPLIGVRHISTKDVSGGALRRVLGSTAWIGVPRVVLAVANDPSDPAIMHFHPIKGNRVPASEGGREFRLEGRLLPGFKESVVCVVPAGASDVDIDAMLSGGKTETGSKQARALILETLREAPGKRMESDQLDATVAEEAGVTAKTVQNLRSELRNKGLIRSTPERDSLGEVQRWYVTLTNAAESLPDENPEPSRGNKQTRDLVSFGLDPESSYSREGGILQPELALSPEETAAVDALFDENGKLR